ncbi:MAG: alpha-2-macroglobulin, partial [Desulfobacteraceae bacterium]
GGASTIEDQVLTFKTPKPFLAKLSGKKEKPASGFIPLLPMSLTFSAPVSWETVKEIRLKSQSGQIWKPKKREESGPYVDRVFFEGPFPEDHSFTLHLPKNIKDDSGRPLTNQDKFPLTIKTDRYPSLAKFASRFGIIEAKEPSLLPVTVRNLEAEITAWMTGAQETPEAGGARGKKIDPGQRMESVKGKLLQVRGNEEEKIIEWLNLLRTAKRKSPLLKGREGIQQLILPKPGGPKELEVLGIPLKAPGFYLVELESEILGSRLLAKPAPMYVPAAALVTNLSAHFKWGQASSLVWVTMLDKGDPVKEASVTLRDCAGKRLWEGKTDELGLAKITGPLPSEDSLRRCSDKQVVEEYNPALSGLRGGLFVFAKAGQDLTFTHSSWNQGIEPWRFNVPTGTTADRLSVLAHTVFDRTLFRAGEEVHMKHVVRRRSPRGLFIPPEIKDLKEVVVEHAGTHQPTVFPLKWRTNGTAETVFKIPEKTKLGTYEVYLAAAQSDPSRSGSGPRIQSGSFRVEEFRVPLMKAVIQGPREPLVNARELELDVAVSFLSGGGAAHLPVKIRTEGQP